jgi:hypothetical protein
MEAKRFAFIVAPSQEYISAAMRTEQALSLNIAERMAKARADRVDKEHLGKTFTYCWNFVLFCVSCFFTPVLYPIRIFLNLS